MELLIVVAMLALMFLLLFGILNPFEQYSKSKDATREHDLNQVRNSLDTYFNDKGCYTQLVPFGIAWSQNGSIYMNQTPLDPTCNLTTRANCYIYQTDTTLACPQWNVLYGKLQSSTVKTSDKILCPLTEIPNCLPPDWNSSGYNFCLTSGNVDCSYISSHALPTPYFVIGTLTPTQPIQSPTPTPPPATPTVSCNIKKYKCTAVDQNHPLGICNNVGINGDFCGLSGCVGNACCDNMCSQ